MRFLSILSPALLAATAFATEGQTITSSSEASSISSASSASPPSSASSSESASSSPAVDEPTPVGELWTAKWTDADLTPYTKKCVSTATIKAEIYKLGEIYPTLKTWAPELKVFYHKQLYPGSWNGEDKHGNDRELMKLDFEELPFAVREWIQRNPKQRHFSVQDDVVFFAPGAIYPILPLWVDEPEEGDLAECEGLFEDLENYSNEPKDGVVIGRLSHKQVKNEVEVTIEAFQVKKTEQRRDEL